MEASSATAAAASTAVQAFSGFSGIFSNEATETVDADFLSQSLIGCAYCLFGMFVKRKKSFFLVFREFSLLFSPFLLPLSHKSITAPANFYDPFSFLSLRAGPSAKMAVKKGGARRQCGRRVTAKKYFHLRKKSFLSSKV
jgi:hypothetical protein